MRCDADVRQRRGRASPKRRLPRARFDVPREHFVVALRCGDQARGLGRVTGDPPDPRLVRMFDLGDLQSESQVPTEVPAAARSNRQPRRVGRVDGECGDDAVPQVALQPPRVARHSNVPSDDCTVKRRVHDQTLRALVHRLHLHHRPVVLLLHSPVDPRVRVEVARLLQRHFTRVRVDPQHQQRSVASRHRQRLSRITSGHRVQRSVRRIKLPRPVDVLMSVESRAVPQPDGSVAAGAGEERAAGFQRCHPRHRAFVFVEMCDETSGELPVGGHRRLHVRRLAAQARRVFRLQLVAQLIQLHPALRQPLLLEAPLGHAVLDQRERRRCVDRLRVERNRVGHRGSR